MRTRWRVAVGALTLAVTVLAGCGGDDAGTDPLAQPAPNDTTFAPGTFDEIPLVTGSDPVAPRSSGGAVTIQSFTVSGWTPERVIAFYAERLPGWSPVDHVEEQPGALAPERLHQAWVRGDERLEVSAWNTQETTDLSRPLVQYRLELRPARS